MAGRFSFAAPGRRSAGDPWFRIGTLDVTTTILVILLCVGGMFLWAFAGNVWDALVLLPAEVRGGQLWRLFTWPIANVPDIWPVITLGIFWYFGREIEGMLGRAKFMVLLLVLTVVPGIFGVLLDISQAGLAPVELGVFLIFIAEYPYVRFFFGIPAWAIGAVIVGIQLLQYIGLGEEERILLLLISIAVAGLAARSMGLAQSLQWIPKIPLPGGGGGGSSRRRRAIGRPRGPAGTGGVVAGPWSASSRGAPPTGGALPQPPSVTDHDQAELDTYLEKIHAGGLDALTADEKHRLNELSKRLRNRK